jgi:hypothetical protein
MRLLHAPARRAVTGTTVPSTRRRGRSPLSAAVSRAAVCCAEALERRTLMSITAAAQPISPAEGAAFNGTVATFSDTDPSPLASYAATINWGDGTTDTGTVAFDAQNNRFTVSGTHTYVEDGPTASPLLVGITESNGADQDAATASEPVVVTEGFFALSSGTPLNAVEGTPITFQVATFNDPGTNDTAADFTAMIDWGDGTTSAGVITGSNGDFTVTGTHTYADEIAAASNAFYSVTVGEPAANFTIGPVGAPVTVGEGDFGTIQPATITTTEGTPFSGAVGSFTDEGNPSQVAGDWTATIDWGDGTVSPGTVGGPTGGPFVVSGSHTYLDEGSFTVTTNVADDPPSTLSFSIMSTATVAEGDVLAPAANQPAVAPTTGQPFNGPIAAFTNAGFPNNTASDFTATIDWGDGTITAGVVSGGSGAPLLVSGTHTYSQAGPKVATVTLSDDAPGTATAVAINTFTVQGNLVAHGAGPILVNEGASTGTVTVATFSDAGGNGPASQYTATIDWGDGTTSPGTITGPSDGAFSVTGSHTYAEEGLYDVHTTVSGGPQSNGSNVATTQALVVDAPLAASGKTLTGTAGKSTGGVVVATFTDADPDGEVGDYIASIQWGDGTVGAGLIRANGSGGFDVVGNHTYGSAGAKNITVSIHDAGSAAIAHATANIAPAPLPTLSINDVSLTEGNSGPKNFTFTVKLSKASASTVTVNFATANGTALAGSDYLVKSGVLTFAPGQTSKTVVVQVKGDTMVEPNETFFVKLSGATHATIADNSGTGTIQNDDPSQPPAINPGIRVNDVSITEGNSGTKLLTFTVSLSGPTSKTVSVKFTTSDGTAKAAADNDYVSQSGVLTFLPGQTTRTVSVVIKGDVKKELNENLLLVLSAPVNSYITDPIGIGTIVNDD